MINNTAVENKHPTEANIDTVYPITFSGATDSGGLPMFKVTLTYADGSSKELEYNVDYKLVYDDVQENNNESFNKPHLNGIKFLLPEYAVDGNTLYILRTTPFEQPVDFQIGRIDPEQIEKIADLSVLRDQEIRNQANKDRDNISDLYDITADLRTDVDTAQDSADAAMAHTVAVEKRVAVNETGIATNKSAAARAQETASDAMAHTVAVEKRVTQAEKNITSNDGDIAKIFSHQEKQDGRLTNLENSKQDKLTAGDNIIISNNVISATGTGGAGFDAIVVQELPESGQKGIIYLLAKDGTAPDVYDEYVWITATQTFELIGSTKVDLSNYLPLSGGTLTGSINFDLPYGSTVLKFGSSSTAEIKTNYQGYLRLPAFTTVHSRLDVDGNIGGTWNTVTTAYIRKLSCGGNNDAKLIVPDTAGTLARLEDLENIDALPDQTDNAGKFLTTDGTTASWSDKPLVNQSGNIYSIAVGAGTVSAKNNSIAIGWNATCVGGVALGSGCLTSSNAVAVGTDCKVSSGGGGLALGYQAVANGEASAQICLKTGYGYTNNDANTVKIANANGNFEMMSADGTIPADRMSATAGTTGQVLTKTDTGMEWQEPSGGTTITLKEYDE